MATDLGKVGMRMRGDWNSSTAYEVLDAVSYAGGLYVAKQAVPANTAPTNTTYWQPAINAIELIPDGYNHNGIYRGKNMGVWESLADVESFLALHEVSTGKFTDLFLGDYFQIKDGTYNNYWMVAGFGTEIRNGASGVLTNNHHVTLIPTTYVTTAKMNSTSTTGVSQNPDNPFYSITGGTETAKYQGYRGSDMAQITLPAIDAALQNVLGTHLLERNVFMTDTINASIPSAAGTGLNGAATGAGWYKAKSALMSEVQIFGSTAAGSSYLDVGEGKEKLPIFNFINYGIYIGRHLWLRAVSSAANFAFMSSDGVPYTFGAASNIYVCPTIVIG